MVEIKIDENNVIAAFNRLAALGERPQPALKSIGEKVLEFTKSRFSHSADPYGAPWAQNADTTLRKMLHGSSKNFTKKGSLSKKGAARLAGKKPLIGESKTLAHQFNTLVAGDSVTIASMAIYASTMQFGAKQGAFGRDSRNHPIPWGDIPARPFFPNAAQGWPTSLHDDVYEVLRIAIQHAATG